MFRQPTSRADRARHEARSLAKRGLARGRHSAETLRESAEALREALPEAGAVLADLREQAEPVLRAAREQAEKTPLPQRKRSRSKKPFVFVAFAVIGAVIAYILYAKRDDEPAYLMHEPDAPDASPADPPAPAAGLNGSAPTDTPATPATAPTAHGDVDVPERVSASMAAGLAQPTQASSSAFAGLPRASVEAPSFAPAYEPRSQVAAWDLPPSSVPPMRGQVSL